MHLAKRHLSKHARARLIVWTLAMLAWIAWALSATTAPKRRHIRRSYGFISLDRLARMVALLIVTRAGELARTRRRNRSPFFNRIRGRQLWPRHVQRSIISARLRRALKHKNFTSRVALLTDALKRIDAWATPLVKRLRHGMTKLWPRRTTPTPAAPLVAPVAVPVFLPTAPNTRTAGALACNFSANRAPRRNHLLPRALARA